MSVSDEQMSVVRALRQAFEMYGGGGSAVQATNNPFFLTVNGSFDLLKTADLLIANLDHFRAHKVKQEALAVLAEAVKKAAETAETGDDSTGA